MGLKDYAIAMLYTIILIVSVVYCWYKFEGKKVRFKNYKLYATIISATVITAFNFLIINKYIRIILITIILILIY